MPLHGGCSPSPSSSAQLDGAETDSPKASFETVCTCPSDLPTEFKLLLLDVRDRQEQLFGEVLEQQKHLQDQLLEMHADFKRNIDANATEAAGSQAWNWPRNLPARKWDLYMGLPRYTEGALKQTQLVEIPEVVNPSFPSEANSPLASEPPSPGQKRRHFGSARSVSADGSEVSWATAITDMPHDAKTDDFMHNIKRKKSNSDLESPVVAKSFLSETLYDRARRIIHSKEFELGIAAAIMLNAFVMCWECQYHGLDVGFHLQFPGRASEAHVVWPGATTTFLIFDWLFGILFIAEMVLKLGCLRGGYFYVRHVKEQPKKLGRSEMARDRKWLAHGHGGQQHTQTHGLQLWNMLDCSCAVAFFFDKMTVVSNTIDPKTIRLLRLFRLARLVRLLRFLQSLDHLYVMTTAILGVSRVLAWAVVLLTMMLLTCDLLLVQTLHGAYFDKVRASDLSEDELERYHRMYEYFGTSTRCMLSMFEITLGNWPPVARLLSEEVSQWFALVCIVHKVTIGFSVVGVITGVILQETFEVARTDDIIIFRQKARALASAKKKMISLFDALDESRDGKVDAREFDVICDLPELQTWLASLGIETEDMHMLFNLVDRDGDGFITADEMVEQMPRLAGHAKSLDLLAFQRQLLHSVSNAAPLHTGFASCDLESRFSAAASCAAPSSAPQFSL